jgi:FMN phosphatase YigB (HAD superfamily)
MLQYLFDPQAIARCMKPIPCTTSLLDRCTKTSACTFYILSNWDKTSFNILYNNQTDAQQVFRYFKKQNIMISATTGLVKPERKLFEHFLTYYSINRAKALYIDNQQENIAIAQKCNLQSILFDINQPQKLITKLKELSVI